MFYRRKVVLAILEIFGGALEKISLQKLLFVFCKQQKQAAYDFVPYNFGCYSFSAGADMTAMIAKNICTEDSKKYYLVENKGFISLLNDVDKQLLRSLKSAFTKTESKELMKYTYLSYPYYAINSKMAKDILTENEYATIAEYRPKNDKTILYTIGYEGVSLEAFFNKLIKNDIKVLCDVRNNPLSMKYGFSKKQLMNYCNVLGIEYIHLPELGIISTERQDLKAQKDYDILFEKYKSANLLQTINTQQKVLSLLMEKKRIALMCFEANICQCHRKPLAESIMKLPDWQYEMKHI